MSEPLDELELCLRALVFAVRRWPTAAAQSVMDPDHEAARFAAIGESLHWAAILDDLRGRPRDTIEATLLYGLRFARNRATHGSMITTSRLDKAYYPLREPLRDFDYVWRNVSELPLPDVGPGSGAQAIKERDAYARAWQGQRVDETLYVLVGYHRAVVAGRGRERK